MKKRNQKKFECQTSGRKILCGRFAQKMKFNYAVGDQDNNLLLYNNLSQKPLCLMNTATSNVSSLTSLTFANQDSLIIAGSNRGSLNAWDIQNSKVSFCLKGHTIQVTSMYTDKNNSNLITTGSLDTNTKLWDLRSKNCIMTYRNQTKKISSLNITPDSRILISGSQDGSVQSWQIRMQKMIFQYDINSSVLSIDTNNNNLMSIGSMDRIARIYTITSPFTQYGHTKNQTMPITNCLFYKQNYLFTAGTDNLKVWDVEYDIILTDNIQTSSKGILHMTLVNDEKIQQIAFSGGSLSYHECMFKDVNFSRNYQTSTIINNKNDNIKFDKYDDKQFQLSSPLIHNNYSTLKRGKSINQNNKNILQKYISNQKTKQLIINRSQSINKTIAKNLSDVNTQVHDVLANIKRVSQSFNNNKRQLSQLNSLMNIMGAQHLKFIKIITNRSRNIQMLIQMWNKGNIKMIIQQIQNVDIFVVNDVLKEVLKPSRYQITVEFALFICEKAKEMLFGKYNSLAKSGVTFLLRVVSMFKDEIFRLKANSTDKDKGVDLVKQQKIKRFDQIIQVLIQVYQSIKLKKIIQKNDQASSLAKQLQIQLAEILNKVLKNNNQNLK